MSTVLWEQDGPIGRITLNRPETINAWTAEFGKELVDTVDAAAADDSVRAVLITGAGRAFSSGANLKAGSEPHPDDQMPDVRKELHLYHGAITGIRRMPKPVVAAVHRAARGLRLSLPPPGRLRAS